MIRHKSFKNHRQRENNRTTPTMRCQACRSGFQTTGNAADTGWRRMQGFSGECIEFFFSEFHFSSLWNFSFSGFPKCFLVSARTFWWFWSCVYLAFTFVKYWFLVGVCYRRTLVTSMFRWLFGRIIKKPLEQPEDTNIDLHQSNNSCSDNLQRQPPKKLGWFNAGKINLLFLSKPPNHIDIYIYIYHHHHMLNHHHILDAAKNIRTTGVLFCFKPFPAPMGTSVLQGALPKLDELPATSSHPVGVLSKAHSTKQISVFLVWVFAFFPSWPEHVALHFWHSSLFNDFFACTEVRDATDSSDAGFSVEDVLEHLPKAWRNSIPPKRQIMGVQEQAQFFLAKRRRTPGLT